MRKKWTYVAIVSMMLGVAPVFTGCVDTDEPAGIEQLRGAKAELLRAKAAVQQANAAIQQAKVAYVEACTREKNAIALQQEMEAERRRLENEWQQLENDEKRAQVEQAIAYLEQKMAEQALDHEKTMLEKQAALEKAKREYELTMQAIEIAEAIGSDKVKVTLTSLKGAVEEAYDVLYTNENADGETLEDELYAASEDLYNALQNKKKGYDTNKKGVAIKKLNKEYWPATLEAIKGQKEVELQIAQEALESLQAAAELPVEDTDWRNQVDAMGEEIDALVAERDQKRVQRKEAQAAPEYIDAWQAAYGVFKEQPSEIGDTESEVYTYMNGGKEPSKNGTLQDRDEAKGSLDWYKENTEIPTAAYALPESIEGVSDVVMEALGFTKTGDPVKNKEFFSYGEGTYKWLDDQSQPADSADLPQSIQDHLGWSYDKWLDALEVAVIKPNDVAKAEAELTAKKEDEKEALDEYNTAVDDWKDVLDIISKQTNYTEIDKTALQDAVKAYQGAYKTLNDRIKEWNDALQTAYDEGKAEKTAELEAAIIANAWSNPDVIAAFQNPAAAQNAANTWPSTDQNQEALDDVLNLFCDATEEATKAEIIQAVKTAINGFISDTKNTAWHKLNDPLIAAEGVQSVKDFAKEDKAAGDKGYSDPDKGLIANAVSGVQNAYDNADEKEVDLMSAIESFKEVAKGFAQSTADALNAVAMVKAADATAVNTSWVANDKDFEKSGVYTMKVLNSDITDDEVTKATVVEFNPDWATDAVTNDIVRVTYKDEKGTVKENHNGTLNALQYRSWLAFGYVDRYVAPERAEVEAIEENTQNGDEVISKAEALYDATYEVEKQQAIIDAQDDLKELQAALTDGKKAFLDQIAKDYTENFGEQQAAYTAAIAAHEKAVANLSDVREKLFGELDAEIDRLTAEIKANREVYDKLKQLAWKYLNITWPATDTDYDYTQPNPSNAYDPETFADELKKAIAYQQVLVAEAEQAVQEAQVNLDQATSGEYDGVHYFQFKLDQIQREWDRAYAEYEEAMANLEKGMAVIAQEAGSEQPAE